jgi:hypothetical protein
MKLSKTWATPLLCAGLAALAPAGGAAGQTSDQAAAGRSTGLRLSEREIVHRILPRLKGAQYLGFEFDPEKSIYTLKFLRSGSVIWVDVDGYTGNILPPTSKQRRQQPARAYLTTTGA